MERPIDVSAMPLRRSFEEDDKGNEVLALRFSVGFLVQVLPCVVLCAIPFSDCFRGVRKRVYALLAAMIIAQDALFVAAAVGPLSDMSIEASGFFQNILFFAFVAMLLAVFIWAIDASVVQKLFVFFLAACFGYFSSSLGNAVFEALGLSIGPDGRLYDSGKLVLLAACTAALFPGMAYVMRSVRMLIAAPLQRRAWIGMTLLLAVVFFVLVSFDIVPRYVIGGERNAALTVSVTVFAALLLCSLAFSARAIADGAEKRMQLASIAEDCERQKREIKQAHARVEELTEALSHLGRGAADAVEPDSGSMRGMGSDDSVVLTTGNKAVSFLASDVVYAESLNRVRWVHLAGGEAFRVNMTLAQISGKLPADRFVYCHRSVVVNLDYVRLLSEETLTLTDGTQIPVGRRRMQEVRKAFEGRVSQRGSAGRSGRVDPADDAGHAFAAPAVSDE